MPTITVTQVNTSATVLGVTNVNAYLNQINCLASVSEESQTTIAIPQQTYITATCGSLYTVPAAATYVFLEDPIITAILNAAA